MLKITALIFAAVVACTAIGTWAAANSRSQERTFRAASTPVDPFALMKAAPSNLPHQQYDAH